MGKKKVDDFNHLNEAMNEMDATGFEAMNMETIAIPFIRILQDGSPQIKKKKPEYIAGAEAGMLFNTITDRLYELPLRFVVGKFDRHFIEWEPNRGPFVASHDPDYVLNNPHLFARDEKKKLYNIESGNHFVETYIYYTLFPDYIDDGVCILSMSSSQIKQARKLNRMLTTTTIPGTTRKALPYFMIWNYDIVEETNDHGDWFGPKITLDSMVTPAVLENVVETREQLPNRTVDLAQIEDRTVETQKGDVQY